MKNTVIAITLTFFVAATGVAISAWFVFGVQVDWLTSEISTYDVSKSGGDESALGLLHQQEEEIKYWEAEKAALLAALNKQKSATDMNAEDLKRAEADLTQFSKTTKEIMDGFCDPKDPPASQIVKLHKQFEEGETSIHAQEDKIVKARADQRKSVVQAEQTRETAYAGYAQVKREVENIKIEVRAEEGTVRRKHQDALALHEMIRARETAKPDFSEDGHILLVGAENTNLVVIDRGAHEGLKEGMRFTVFRKDRAENIYVVGRILVRKVDLRTSEAVMLPVDLALPTCPECHWTATDPNMRYCVFCFKDPGMPAAVELVRPFTDAKIKYDPFRPVIAGDIIWDDTYDRKTKLHFYLGTETAFRSRAELQKFILENGGEVVEKLDPHVDYFIPGVEQENDELYKQARRWGVRIMTVREVFAWFGKPMAR